MITAHGAQVVAYTTEQGSILCAKHCQEKWGAKVEAYRETHKVKEHGGYFLALDEAFAHFGLNPLMRIEVQEWDQAELYGNDEPMEMVCDIDGEAI